MKKTIAIFVTVTLLLTLLAGCGKQQGKLSEGGKLSVYVSFYPLYDFAQKVGGDRVEVVNLVPIGMEPHDWEPAAMDIARLEEADILVYNGAGLEHWVDSVLPTLQNQDLIVVEAAQGIALREGYEGHAEHEDESEHEDEPEHEEEQVDPHTWLDPQNAKKQMQNIQLAFAQADPENATTYQDNYNRYAAEFDALDKEYREGLSGLTNRDLVVSHEAFGYLCAAYQLNQMGVEGLSPDSEPDPARMAEIIDFVREHSVKVIFFEEMASDKVSQTIAKATGAQTDMLNPLEGLSEEQLNAGEDYFSIMRQNLEKIIQALR